MYPVETTNTLYCYATDPFTLQEQFQTWKTANPNKVIDSTVSFNAYGYAMLVIFH